jgi:hypothetical protein
VRKISTTSIAGARSGSVMCRSCHHGPAPSVACRLVERAVDVLEPRQQEQRDERESVFHTSARITGTHAVAASDEPDDRLVQHAGAHEHRVGDSRLRVEHESPEQRSDHGRDRPWDEHCRTHQPPPAEGLVQREREEEAEHELERDRA